MTTQLEYEWVVEQIDGNGDITDCEYMPSLADVEAYSRHLTGRIDVGLVRNVWESDGTLADRQYAYALADGSIPDTFEGGAHVPKRFRQRSAIIGPSTQTQQDAPRSICPDCERPVHAPPGTPWMCPTCKANVVTEPYPEDGE